MGTTIVESEPTTFVFSLIECPKCKATQKVLYVPKHREYCGACGKWSAPEKWTVVDRVTETKKLVLCFDDE